MQTWKQLTLPAWLFDCHTAATLRLVARWIDLIRSALISTNMAVITSSATAVEKYCDQHVCLCVCLCVCLSVCPPVYLRSHTSEIAKFLCMLPMAVARSSSASRRHQKGNGAILGFSSPLTMHYNAFAANGIGREGGDGSAQRGRTVGLIYDYLVTIVCGFGGYYMRAASASCHRVSWCAANETHIEFSIFVAENHFCKWCVTLWRLG